MEILLDSFYPVALLQGILNGKCKGSKKEEAFTFVHSSDKLDVSSLLSSAACVLKIKKEESSICRQFIVFFTRLLFPDYFSFFLSGCLQMLRIIECAVTKTNDIVL